MDDAHLIADSLKSDDVRRAEGIPTTNMPAARAAVTPLGLGVPDLGHAPHHLEGVLRSRI
ncbi:MAG: hypothetical protein ACRDK3_16020 [Actinomycetota bacterium]